MTFDRRKSTSGVEPRSQNVEVSIAWSKLEEHPRNGSWVICRWRHPREITWSSLTLCVIATSWTIDFLRTPTILHIIWTGWQRIVRSSIRNHQHSYPWTSFRIVHHFRVSWHSKRVKSYLRVESADIYAPSYKQLAVVQHPLCDRFIAARE